MTPRQEALQKGFRQKTRRRSLFSTIFHALLSQEQSWDTADCVTNNEPCFHHLVERQRKLYHCEVLEWSSPISHRNYKRNKLCIRSIYYWPHTKVCEAIYKTPTNSNYAPNANSQMCLNTRLIKTWVTHGYKWLSSMYRQRVNAISPC